MPKETFYNLPAIKKSKIEQAIIKIFSNYAYDAVTINQLVDAADIPKGSFYQYFSDKKDAYRHLIDLITDKKLAALKPLMINPAQDNIFVLIEKLYQAGLVFAKENPLLQKVSSRMLADRKHPVFQSLLKENIEKSDLLFNDLLTQAVAKKEIREGLDLGLTAHIISTMSVAMSDYYMEQKNHVIDDDYMTYASQMIDILKHGISRPKNLFFQADEEQDND